MNNTPYSFCAYLGSIELDKIPEHDPQQSIRLFGDRLLFHHPATAPAGVDAFLIGDIGRIALWKQHLLYGNANTPGSEEFPLPSEQECPRSIKLNGYFFRHILPFGNGVVQVYGGRNDALDIVNLRSGKKWGSIEYFSRITALDIFNGDSIVAGFEDGSVRMWSYSPE